MSKKFRVILIFLFSHIILNTFSQSTQNFSASPGVAITRDNTYHDYSMTVATSLSIAAMNSTWGLYRVRLNITHQGKYNLSAQLTSPGGVTIDLVIAPASYPGSYDDYNNSWFRDDAPMKISTFLSSYSGYRYNSVAAWIPESAINNMNNGSSPDGAWKLKIKDKGSIYTGTLNSWELEFRQSPGGDRTSSMWVTNSETAYPSYDNCSSPKLMDKGYTYYGRTRLTYSGNGTTDPKPKGVVGDNFDCNAELNNTVWYQFKTDASGGNVNIDISMISLNSGSTGYQAVLISSTSPCIQTNWSRPTGSSLHGFQKAAYASSCIGYAYTRNNSRITANLTANTVYYVCVDGLGTGDGTPYSDVEFQIEATGAVKSDYTTLPIELRYYNAACEGHEINLKWSTYSETNNDYFTIEKSSDLMEYTEIAKVDGAGNSNNILNYEYTDDEYSADVMYYRLKQTDFDGKFEYFGPIAVTCNNKNNDQINIYPNPANDFIVISNLPDKTIRIELTDIIGNSIISETPVKDNFIELKPLYISKGIYFLKIESEGQTFIRKVLVE
jgi:subtilisin-like proprotein convertase family protein